MKSRWKRKAVPYSGNSLMRPERKMHKTPVINPRARRLTLLEREQVLAKVNENWTAYEVQVWMAHELGVDRELSTVEKWVSKGVGEIYPNSTITPGRAAKELGMTIPGFKELVAKGVIQIHSGTPSTAKYDPGHIEEMKNFLFGGSA